MKNLKQFFWICSGSDIELLEKCPSESSKYAGIGATIFFTGVFAAIAGGYALYTVFDSVLTATIFGLIWGFMIFNLDRYIVSSMRKENKIVREFATALPRIFLAILISLVIAKPLEMKIFDKEISAELRIMEQEKFAEQEEVVRQRFLPDLERSNRDLALLKTEIEQKEAVRDQLREIARAEADGTGGTMRRNAGPIYKIKKADADRVEQELLELKKSNEKLINERTNFASANDSLMLAEMNALEQGRLDGPAARMEALSRLTADSNAIWWANFFIILLFLAVETAPVFVKLITPQGPYDHLLKIREYVFEAQRAEDTSKINVDTKDRVIEFPEFEKDFVKERLESGLKSS
ncbi:MAG: DUF4407 domain-containing protein [Bacteroidia bacterium]|nr:DUF4407 domain-containing protein [Bacteroidia bacterium]